MFSQSKPIRLLVLSTNAVEKMSVIDHTCYTLVPVKFSEEDADEPSEESIDRDAEEIIEEFDAVLTDSKLTAQKDKSSKQVCSLSFLTKQTFQWLSKTKISKQDLRS